MFAVKGWNVDTSLLKTQTEPFKSTTHNSEQKRSRKRKREDGPPKEDVGKLWEQHIEGKKELKKKKKERERKRGTSEKRDRKSGKDELETEKQDSNREDGQDKRQRKAQDKRPDEAPSKSTLHKNSQPKNVQSKNAHLGDRLTPMQSAMRQKLISARFRHLNETLYTAPSKTALDLFDQNPDMFDDYHAGFRQQVSVWPENPLDHFINTLQSRGTINKKSKQQREALPRTQGTCIVADLGCGDARLAQTFKNIKDGSKLNLKIHSFDLHSPSSLVTKADISNLPLADGSVDVAIFCLALMGTNWVSFIEEAYRVLHWKGELWVAEIKSRFGRVGKAGRAGKPVEHSVGSKKKQASLKKIQEAKRNEEEQIDEETALKIQVDGVEMRQQDTDVSGFVDVLRRRGFVLKPGEKSIDLDNKMFVKMEFIKAASPTKGDSVDDVATEDETGILKPCLYKIR